MIVALLFIFSSLFLGTALAKNFPSLLDSRLKKIAFAIFTGFFFSSWIALVLYWLVFAGLTQGTIAAASTLSLIAGAVLWRIKNKKAKETKENKEAKNKESKWALAGIAIVFGTIFLLNLTSVFYTNPEGGISAIVNVWGDGPMHLSLINSFVLGQNYPPQYFLLNGSPLTYPFLTDFATAVLIVGGLDWQTAILFFNIILAFPLVCFAFFLTKEFSKSQIVALLLLFLFFFNGNFGILNAISDAGKGGFWPLKMDYAHFDGEAFMNITYFMLMPQRSAFFGFTAALLVLWLLYRFISQKTVVKREVLLAGIITGLMPLAHTHSFAVIALVSFYWFLTEPRKEWLWFFAPAILLAIPQVLWISQHTTGAGFFGMQIGWLGKNTGKNLLELAWFWVQQLPIAIWLAIPAFFFLSAEQRKFTVPFVLLFIIANVVRFQPYDWDNIKILLFSVLVFLALAAMALEKLWNLKNKNKLLKNGVKIAVASIFVFSIASGILSMLWIGLGENAHYEIFPQRELQVAGWIKQNTPATAVFLTSDQHNHLVPALAGRRIVMGYRGWLWTHGVDYSQQEQGVERMYQMPSCDDFKKYGIDYVFAGPQESGLNPNIDFFENNFEKVYDKTFDNTFNFKIYKVIC